MNPTTPDRRPSLAGLAAPAERARSQDVTRRALPVEGEDRPVVSAFGSSL